jgi:hypothetical protein
MPRLDSGFCVSLGCPCGFEKATGAIEIATDAPCYEFLSKTKKNGFGVLPVLHKSKYRYFKCGMPVFL